MTGDVGSGPTYPRHIVAAGHVEPVARRIRGLIGGHTVLDTTAALYLWQWPYYPVYLIPAADIDPDALVDSGDHHGSRFGTTSKVGLRVGDDERLGVGRRYVASELPGIADTVHFDWGAVDAWLEEDEQVFMHPRNPYTRVDALRSRRRVRVSLEGVVLAESDAPVMVFETGLPPRAYLDRSTVDFSHLRLTDTVTQCPYKGRTSATWSVVVGGREHADLAWSYEFPTRELAAIAGLVAFYDERVDVELDGVAVSRPVTHFSR